MLLPIALWLCACGSAPPTPAPAEPVPAEVPVASVATGQRFVRASTLNLRAGPAASSEALGRLTINSALEPLQTEGDWVRVRVANGKEGWVGSAFLADAVLTVDDAVAAASAEPAEALSWWQRAAAIEPRRDVLEGLMGAYQAAGDGAAAEQVRRQLDWPHTMHLVWEDDDLPPNQVRVQWAEAGYDPPARREVPRESWSRYGLDPDVGWFVLPSFGPAVPAVAVQLTTDPLSDCGGDWSRNVWLEHEPLLEGAAAMVAVRGQPPASWRDATVPAAGREGAEAAIRAAAAARLPGELELSLAPAGAGWAGMARVPTGEVGELGDVIYDEAQVRWTGGRVRFGDVERTADGERMLGVRDVLGSGSPLWVTREWCATSVYDGDGAHRRSTGTRCCGC